MQIQRGEPLAEPVLQWGHRPIRVVMSLIHVEMIGVALLQWGHRPIRVVMARCRKRGILQGL